MGFQLLGGAKANGQIAGAVEWESEHDEGWQTGSTLFADFWAFVPQGDSNEGKMRRTPHSYLASQLSPNYAGLADDGTEELDELRLDSALVGVRIVEEVVQPYEKAVGFPYVLFPKIELADLGPLACLNPYADEEEIVENNRAWSDSLKDFISVAQEMSLPDYEGSMSSSFIDSEQSSGSENSNEFFAMPTTPVYTGSTFADILIKSASPHGSFSSAGIEDGLFSTPAPSKGLNAFASSFVPSFSPPAHSGTFSLASITDSLREKKKIPKSGSKKRDNAVSKASSPSLSSFTFPTLNPPTKSTTRLTTVKIKKDDQGFFTTDVQVNKDKAKGSTTPSKATPAEKTPVAGVEKPSQLLLPPFLQEPSPRRRGRPSRTREMVVRLRSDQTDVTSLSSTFDDVADEPIESIARVGQEYPFDFVPKSASTSHSPSPTDDAFVRPRSSVSEDGAGHRGSIIDGRESQTQSGHSSPSLDEDEEGWIDLGASSVVTSLWAPKRARDLFLAFTRRRTDSISSEPTKETLAGSEHLKSKSEDATADIVQEAMQIKDKPPVKPSKALKKGQWANRDLSKPAGGPAPAKAQRKKPSQPHRHQTSAQGSSTTLSPHAARFNPSGPAFPSLNNPPYVNVPGTMSMLPPPPPPPPNPLHMGMAPTPPTPVPGTFFFNPATPAYHPVGLGASIPAGVYGAVPVPVGFVPVRVPTAPYMPSHMSGVPPLGSAHHRKTSALSGW